MNRKLFAVTTVALMMFAGIGLLAVDSDESEAANSTVNITVAQGQSWSYVISVNLDNPSYSLSGSATSWVTLSDSTVSGTVPMVGSTDTTLIITASTIQLTQSYTQTITFTIRGGVGFILGDSVNGYLDLTTGELLITGTGDMYDFSSSEHYDNPMGDYANYITSIDIGEEVTSIGDCFGNFPEVLDPGLSYVMNVTSITGGEGIITIGYGSFPYLGNSVSGGCNVDWFAFESLEIIGQSAFFYANLDNVIIPDTVTTIERYAFEGVSWTVAIIGNGLTSLGTDVFGEMTFYENDGTTVISGTNIKGNMYSRDNDRAESRVWGTVDNSEYGTDYTYLVSGKTVPNSTEDNLTFEFTMGLTAQIIELIPDYVGLVTNATVVWTLKDSIGTASIGSSTFGNTTSFTSGTAPTVSSPTTISTNAIATMTVTDGASVTVSTDYGLDFYALIVPELQFTSTPE